MARNEEKQQGRLNRLWLQKERDEGRLKGVHERRPKLSTLNSASSVKKWLPSINKEIEYYLQQSQLSHYPERKIAEFQQQIEALEKEYKRFVTKLRVLDPSCKHKPWTPRAYCRRRADPRDSLRDGKSSRLSDGHEGGVETTGSGRVPGGSESAVSRLTATEKRPAPPRAPCRTQHPTEPVSGPPEDQPLSFDRTRLAVAAAAFRRPSGHAGSSQTQTLAKLLQSGLPNLSHAQPASGDAEDGGAADERPAVGRDVSGVTEGRGGHVLGLDGYSSSDDDCDT